MHLTVQILETLIKVVYDLNQTEIDQIESILNTQSSVEDMVNTDQIETVQEL